MTQYNTLNVKLSNSQLNKLKSAIKNETKVTLTNFLYKLLLADTEISKTRKAFANGSPANIKFSKTQLSTMIQSGRILGDLIASIPQAMFLAGKEALRNVYH